MDYLFIGASIFAVSIAIIELLRYALRHADAIKRSKVRKRIKKYTFAHESSEKIDIIKKRVYSEVPFLNRLLHWAFFVKHIDRLVVQAGTRLPLGFFVLVALLAATCGFWGAFQYAKSINLAVLAAVGGLVAPFAWLAFKKRMRIKKFQEQLPEGLDLIARSLKAGHAFTSGMKLAADEFPDPLGAEFQETIEEINYGVSTPQALKSLAGRVDCAEVRYFVVAVILQRETGGNLAELLEGLAGLMRKKVKFEGKVRALAAEGKISALILVLTPLLLAVYLELNNPGYLDVFVNHPMGRMMALGCLSLMGAGIVVLSKMVDIKV